MRSLQPLAALLLASPALAQCPVQEIMAPSSSSVLYGRIVAIDGDVMAAGMPNWPGTFSGSTFEGRVQIRRLGPQGWVDEALVAAPGQPFDGNFGSALAIDGDWLYVGAPGEDGQGQSHGAVHVFEHVQGQWLHRQRLEASDPENFQGFGEALQAEGDWLLVGAPGDDEGGSVQVGAVYSFLRTAGTFVEQQKFSSGTSGVQGFGAALSLDGDRVLVGAPSVPGTFLFTGEAHVFQRFSGVWTLEVTLQASDGEPYDQFGTSVSLDGMTAVVGTDETDDPGQYDPGGVYIYDGTLGWAETQILGQGLPNEEGFGFRVALDGNRLVVGSRAAGDEAEGTVRSYTRDQGRFALEAVLEPAQLEPTDQFGWGLALEGTTVVAGSAALDNFAGRVAIWRLMNSVGLQGCTSNPNSTGQAASLNCTGSEALWEECLRFEASPVPSNQFGYLLMSTSASSLPLAGSQGVLCLGSPVIRFAGDVQSSGSGSSIVVRPDLANLPQGIAFLPGDTWHFQLWFRDVNPLPTSNTTDRVSLTFH